MEYQVRLGPAEEGGFVVTFPEFPFGVTQGDDEAEALANAAEIIELVIADCMEKGVPLPEQKKKYFGGKRYRTVRVPALIAAKAELYRAFRDAHITKAKLASRMAIPRMNVDRLFDLHHQSRLDLIESAFAALGKSLKLSIQEFSPTFVAPGRPSNARPAKKSKRARTKRAAVRSSAVCAPDGK
jgi:antitoxin HicB